MVLVVLVVLMVLVVLVVLVVLMVTIGDLGHQSCVFRVRSKPSKQPLGLVARGVPIERGATGA